MNDSVRPDILEAAFRGRFGRPLKVLEATASTNSDALKWAHEGAPEGALVVAEHQTAGRGRWGRSWFSEPGTGLLLSVVLRPRLSTEQLGLLTTALGVACTDALQETTGLQPSIKWPNDVTVDGRKLAGILVETRVEAGHVDVAVAGIGLNFYRFDLPADIAARATSISDAMERAGLGSPPPRAQVLASLLEHFEDLYEEITVGAWADVVERAAAHSEILGKAVRVVLADGRAFEGLAARLLPTGALELDTGGERIAIDSGEVELVRAK
jgi:BirA family transcriptional regulator, biotin operon repressor / biotin---[acetyl-CoA-carboxylase] ligase